MNKSLGKGLSALLGENIGASNYNKYQNTSIEQSYNNNDIGIERIIPGQFQPRRKFDETSLQELAQSIKSKGLIQPIIVRKIGSDKYEIIAGERRWRAAQIAGLKTIPAIVKEMSDKETIEFALLENIQREDLSPIEEAEAYQKLISDFKYTQEQLSKELGKSRSHVANLLRLLQLPETVKKYLDEGVLTVGHAKVIIGHEQAEVLAEKIIKQNLSVRELENLLKTKINFKENKEYKKIVVRDITTKDDELTAIENGLTEQLGMKVVIEDTPKGGKFIVHFNNLEQLDKIIQRIAN